MSLWQAIPTLTNRHDFTIVDAQHQPIAGVFALDDVCSGFGKERDDFTRSTKGQPEAWANAILIAAAPTMLEALRFAYDRLGIADVEAWDRIRDAIKEATGGPA